MSIAIATRGMIAGLGSATQITSDCIEAAALEVEVDVNYTESLPASSGHEYLPNKRFVEEIAPVKKVISFPLPKHL